MAIVKKTCYRPSSSKEYDIFTRIWAPDKPNAVALIEIAHGIAEHSQQYDAFASFLAQNGFVVFANDHAAGHDEKCENFGYFASKNGWEHNVKDIKSAMDTMRTRYPSLPCFVFGHSMDSFLVRSYIARYGGLHGAVISGTYAPNKSAFAGKLLAQLLIALKGPKYISPMLSNLAGDGYNALTVSGFRDMVTGFSEVSSKKWPLCVPRSLPMLFIADVQDPVGDYGKRAECIVRRLTQTNHSVTLKLYEGGCHEMPGEFGKEQVFEDVLAWLIARI